MKNKEKFDYLNTNAECRIGERIYTNSFTEKIHLNTFPHIRELNKIHLDDGCKQPNIVEAILMNDSDSKIFVEYEITN